MKIKATYKYSCVLRAKHTLIDLSTDQLYRFEVVICLKVYLVHMYTFELSNSFMKASKWLSNLVFVSIISPNYASHTFHYHHNIFQCYYYGSYEKFIIQNFKIYLLNLFFHLQVNFSLNPTVYNVIRSTLLFTLV